MKSINANAPVKCTRSITINASQAKVWSVLTNVDKWANWQTDISSATLSGAIAPDSRFVWKTGGATIHSILHTVQPDTFFGWTGRIFGMYAIHNWSLSEKDGKTIVHVEESMEGFLASLFSGYFNKSLEKGMEIWLGLLKAEAEK
jgi:uncharacterized protein YndB with AHSA1/START domain